MENYSRVKIADIARRAGVSNGTVDRVLHNRGEVAARTREKILAIIKEMDFEPDILASTLASKKTFRFASLIPEATNYSQFWNQPALGLEKALRQVRHFGIVHQPFYFNYFDKETFKSALEEVRQSNPDGVILAPFFSDLAKEFVDECQEKNIAVVFINMNILSLPKLSFVGQDPFQSGMVAGQLLDYGLKQDELILIINIMSKKGDNLHLLNREEGFRAYFEDENTGSKLLHTINIHGNDPESIHLGITEGINTIRLSNKPAGIFVTNSRVFHVADYLVKNKLQGIRLLGYDLLDSNIEHLKNRTIDFLISQNPIEQGTRSFMALFDTCVYKKNVPENQYLPIDIITRENIDYYLKSNE